MEAEGTLTPLRPSLEWMWAADCRVISEARSFSAERGLTTSWHADFPCPSFPPESSMPFFVEVERGGALLREFSYAPVWETRWLGHVMGPFLDVAVSASRRSWLSPPGLGFRGRGEGLSGVGISRGPEEDDVSLRYVEILPIPAPEGSSSLSRFKQDRRHRP